MELRPKTPLLPFLVLCSLLFLLPLVSSVPMSRNLRLRNQRYPPPLKLTSQGVMQVTAARNLGDKAAAAARMAVEVDDYPLSGPNNSHDPPKGPLGRA